MKKLFLILFAIIFTMGCSDDNEGGNASGIKLSTSELVYLANGDAQQGDKTLQVITKGKWTLTGSTPWCLTSATEGEGGENIMFVVGPNPESEPRSFTYTFTNGGKEAKLVITQMPGSVLNFDTPTAFNVPVEGGPVVITVIATKDMTYKVAEKDQEWIAAKVARAVETSVLTFTVSPNPTFAPRTGDIIFNVEDKEVIVKINQAQTVKLDFPKTEYEIGPAGENVTVNYTANVEVVPDLSQASWVTLVSHTASVAFSPGKMVFQIETTEETRTASIPIKSPNGLTTYETLTFEQSASQVIAMIPDAKFSEWLIAQEYAKTTGTANMFVITGAGMAATTFNIPGRGIASLEGIEMFAMLETLDCSDNLLTKLDLSNPNKISKLNCESNNIKVLNLKGCAEFASVGTLSTNALRVQKNCFEEIHLSDNCVLRFTVAGADRLTGKNGVKSTTLKVYAKKIPALLCGLTKSLKTVDITECPACVEFKGGTEADGIQTVYITAAQEVVKNNSTTLFWQIPSGGSFIVK